jgi:Ni/Co efflux regulator RcnB
MSEIVKSEAISRRRALSLFGKVAASAVAACTTALTVSDAEAQTPGAEAPTPGVERRQERRSERHERREERRSERHERREERRTARTERREERRTGTTTGTSTGQKP